MSRRTLLATAVAAVLLGAAAPAAAPAATSDFAQTTPTFTATPPSVTNQTAASFAISLVSALSFQCSLDNGAWRTCAATPTYRNLRAGGHTLQVRGVNNLWQTTLPAAYSWLVDLTPPQTRIVTAQVGGAETIGTASEPGAVLQCRAPSDMSWGPCAGDARPGASIRAVDPAGNVDPSPATVPSLSGASARASTGTPFTGFAAVADFETSDNGAATDCSLDGGPFAPCEAPLAWMLPWGTHSLTVRASWSDGTSATTAPVVFGAAAPAPRVAGLQVPTLIRLPASRMPLVRFTLNRAVPVSLRLERLSGGRRRTLARWTVAGTAGANTLRLRSGLVRELRTGRHRLVATPAGGAPATVTFAIVR